MSELFMFLGGLGGLLLIDRVLDVWTAEQKPQK